MHRCRRLLLPFFLLVAAAASAERLRVDEDVRITAAYQAAQRLATAQRWPQAVEAYQEILLTERAWVLVMPGKLGVFQGVAHAASDDLLALPEAAWREAETRYGGTARSQMEAAQRSSDLHALEEVAARYPLTEAARKASAAAVETAVAQGLLAEAGLAWERFARLYANRRPAVDAPGLVAELAGRLVDALARSGPLPALRRVERRLAVLEVLGGPAGSAFASAHQRAAAALAALDTADRPPLFLPGPAGDPDSPTAQSPLGDAGACLWSYRLPGVQELFVSGSSEPEFGPSRPAHHVAADRDCLYLVDGQAISAFVRDGGLGDRGARKAWRHYYRLTLVSDSTNRSQTAVDLGSADLMAPALDDRSVYAVVGAYSTDMPSGQTTIAGRPQLLCVDRFDGRRRWIVDVDANTAPPLLAGVAFYSLPLPVGERVFVVGADMKNAYLVCFARANGEFQWKTALPVRQGAGQFRPEALGVLGTPMPVESGGYVYVSNHLGSLSVVDAFTGAIRWSASYLERNAATSWGRGTGGGEPASNPVVLTDDLVIAHAQGSERLIALKRETGEAAWGGVEIPGLRHVFGQKDGRVYAAGAFAAAIDTKTGKLVWRTPLNDAGQGGRGALTEDSLVCAAGGRITALSLDQGKPLRTYAWRGRSRRVGNLLISGDLLAVIGPDALWAFRLGKKAEPPDGASLEKWVNELGSDDPGVRDRATAALAGAGTDARAALERVREDPREDVAWRAGLLLDRLRATEMLVRER